MAITATIVHAGSNRLRYLLSTLSTGTDTGVITTVGGPTPDILTDLGTHQGPLMLLAKVVAQGYAQFPAGAQTQQNARALWLSDRPGSIPALPPNNGGVDIVPTAISTLEPRSGAASAWFVDANVNAGNPEIRLQSVAVSDGEAPGTCYLDIFVGDAIGD